MVLVNGPACICPAERDCTAGAATFWYDDDEPDRLHVVRADPRAWLHAEAYHALTDIHHPAVTFRDGVLTIRCVERTVVYRMTGLYCWVRDSYLIEWPD